MGTKRNTKHYYVAKKTVEVWRCSDCVIEREQEKEKKKI